MSDSRNLLLLLPRHSERRERERGAGVWQEGEAEFSLGEHLVLQSLALPHPAPGARHLCHARLREELEASSADLAGPGPFPCVAPGLPWHPQPEPGRRGAEGTGLGARESRPCPGVATKPLHLCLCSPARPGLGDRGELLLWPFLGQWGQERVFWMEIHTGLGRGWTSEPHPEANSTEGWERLAQGEGGWRGGGKGGSIIARALIFNPQN